MLAAPPASCSSRCPLGFAVLAPSRRHRDGRGRRPCRRGPGAAHLAARASRSLGLARRRDWPPAPGEKREQRRAGCPRGLPRLAVNSRVAAPGREQRRWGSGWPDSGKDADRLGDACGPTYWQPDGPGLAAAGAGAGAGGGCASLSCTALAASGSNSSHLLIRES